MTIDDDSPEARILFAILSGKNAWPDAITLISNEAEISGMGRTIAAMDALLADEWIARWYMPPMASRTVEAEKLEIQRIKDEREQEDFERKIAGYAPRKWGKINRDPNRGGKAESLRITLGVYGMARMKQTLPDGDVARIDLIENVTNSDPRYGWEGNHPDHYEMPSHGRMPSLQDPRMGKIVDSLKEPEDEHASEDREYLADRDTGEVVMLFGRPVVVAESWSKAKQASGDAKATGTPTKITRAERRKKAS